MLASRRGRSLLQLQRQAVQQCFAQHESRATYARQAPGKAAAKPVAKKASDEGKLQGSFQQLLKVRRRHNRGCARMPAAACELAASMRRRSTRVSGQRHAGDVQPRDYLLTQPLCAASSTLTSKPLCHRLKQSASGAGASLLVTAGPLPQLLHVFYGGLLMLQLLKPTEVEPLVLTPELEAEYTARSKEYSRRMMREHHMWQSDLATKLRLKKVRPSP